MYPSNVLSIGTLRKRARINKSRAILVVDGDALLRRRLAFHPEQTSYHVLTAANAEDALALIRRQRPDLVMLHIGLPGADCTIRH